MIETAIGLLGSTAVGACLEMKSIQDKEAIAQSWFSEDRFSYAKAEGIALTGRVLTALPYLAMGALDSVLAIHWTAKAALLALNSASSFLVLVNLIPDEERDISQIEFAGQAISMMATAVNLAVAGRALYLASESAVLGFSAAPIVFVLGGIAAASVGQRIIKLA